MGFFDGKLVRLRPIREADYEYFATLRNDPLTQGWNQRLPPRDTPQSAKERIEKRMKAQHAGTFAIETTEDALVGYITYNESPQRFGATIGVITGQEHWGKGYAREAHELIFRFLFEQRGLRVISLWTTSWNGRGMAAARKMGFKECVRLRESTIMDGKVIDTIMMDMTRDEYYASRKIKDGLTGA